MRAIWMAFCTLWLYCSSVFSWSLWTSENIKLPSWFVPIQRWLNLISLTQQNCVYEDPRFQRNFIIGSTPIATLNEIVGENFRKIVNNRSFLCFQVSNLNWVKGDDFVWEQHFNWMLSFNNLPTKIHICRPLRDCVQYCWVPRSCSAEGRNCNFWPIEPLVWLLKIQIVARQDCVR